MTDAAGSVLIVLAGLPAWYLVAQANADPQLGWVSAIAQLGSTGVALLLAWWFIQYITKQNETHTTNMANLSKNHSETQERMVQESRAFLREQSDRCHEVHKESTAALRRSVDVSARAAYIIERFAAEHHIQPGAKPPGPSDSVILKHLEGYNEQGKG
jgi:hypothetical protein